MTILQTGRYNEILEKRGSQGALCGMDADFIKKCSKPYTKKV